jgi:hypothetical protein
MKLRTMALLAVALGCSAADTTRERAVDSTSRPAAVLMPAGTRAVFPPQPQPAPGSRGPGRWEVTPLGIGQVHAGMPVAEAGTALGTPLTLLGDSKECDYAKPANASPDSLLFMVVNGRVARVDVHGTAVVTVEGARIGDSESRIDSLYPGRVTVQPHHYSDGHYLVVRSSIASDTTHRIVFETDGKVVTQFRSGRMPEVGWVEGCS